MSRVYRRHVKQPDGTWAEMPPHPPRPLWTIAKGAQSRDVRADDRKDAVWMAVRYLHKQGTTYPYTVTVQRKAGGAVVTVEVATVPQEPVFRLRVVG